MLDYLEQGGIFMWPILLCSVWAFTLLLERFLYFRGTASKFHSESEECFRILESEGLAKAHSSLKAKKGLVVEMLAEAWDPVHHGALSAERGVEEVLQKNLPTLERHLSTISVLAGIQPLLGLLGTITGMISVFSVITTRTGAVDASALAGGISEAMITTQAGLSAAVPILLGHNFLRNRFRNVLSILQSTSARALKEKEKGVAL